MSIKEAYVLVLGIYVFLSTASAQFCLVLHPRGRGRLEAWSGRLGVLVRNLRTMKVVYCVNVSESSGAGSSGLSQIKER